MGSKSDPQNALKLIEETQSDLSDIELAESGAPIPFQVGKREFALRQPDPNEYELIKLWENIGYQEAMLQEGMEALKALPVSDAARIAKQQRLAMLQDEIETTQDTERRRTIDAEMKRLEKPDKRSRAEELAESYSYRYRDIQMIRRLLINADGSAIPKNEVEKLLRTQVFVDLARLACFRIIRLMLTLPNWIERPVSEPS